MRGGERQGGCGDHIALRRHSGEAAPSAGRHGAGALPARCDGSQQGLAARSLTKQLRATSNPSREAVHDAWLGGRAAPRPEGRGGHGAARRNGGRGGRRRASAAVRATRRACGRRSQRPCTDAGCHGSASAANRQPAANQQRERGCGRRQQQRRGPGQPHHGVAPGGVVAGGAAARQGAGRGHQQGARHGSEWPRSPRCETCQENDHRHRPVHVKLLTELSASLLVSDHACDDPGRRGCAGCCGST